LFNRFLAILATLILVFGFSAQVRAGDTLQNSIEVKNKADFVDVQQIIPSLELDIKYATTDNFTHTKL